MISLTFSPEQANDLSGPPLTSPSALPIHTLRENQSVKGLHSIHISQSWGTCLIENDFQFACIEMFSIVLEP